MDRQPFAIVDFGNGSGSNSEFSLAGCITNSIPAGVERYFRVGAQ